MEYTVVLVVEQKEEALEAVPGYPSARELRSRVADVLADVTKHDETIGWRVRAVKSA